MITRVFIFGLLCNVVSIGSSYHIVQAKLPLIHNFENQTEDFLTNDVVPECATLPCASILNRRKRQMDQMDGFLKNHTDLIRHPKLNPSEQRFLKAEFDKVKTLTKNSTAKINLDLHKFCHTLDAETRRGWCVEELKVHRNIFKSIITAATEFKTSLLAVTGFSSENLPFETNEIPQV